MYITKSEIYKSDIDLACEKVGGSSILDSYLLSPLLELVLSYHGTNFAISLKNEMKAYVYTSGKSISDVSSAFFTTSLDLPIKMKEGQAAGIACAKEPLPISKSCKHEFHANL